MRHLTEWLENSNVNAVIHGNDNIECAGITADSRMVQSGMIFAAIQGVDVDGARFVPSAIEAGASAILYQRGHNVSFDGVTGVEVENLRQSVAKLAANYVGKQPKHIVAITGTNGKTSIAEFTRQLWQLTGRDAASMGTLGLTCPDEKLSASVPANNTSADPVLLANTLGELVDHKIDYLAIEASSHGLHQYRLDGVQIESAAFTNLTHDHLDYHPSMDDYFAAKARLFTDLELTSNTVWINADDEYGQKLIALAKDKGRVVRTFGKAGDDIVLKSVVPNASGLNLSIIISDYVIPAKAGVSSDSLSGLEKDSLLPHQCVRGNDEEKTYDIALPLYGAFQAENICAAIGLVLQSGVAIADIVAALPKLKVVRGRMEKVSNHPTGAPVFVDYAHTPDALKQALLSVRAHTQNKLHVVFGCGGNRDKAKRAEMGAVAAKYADHAIVTDDNPRGENSAAIRAAILEAIPDAEEIGDRESAIDAAIRHLEKGDVLVVAGKGHETYQIIGDETHHFDDAEKIRESLERL